MATHLRCAIYTRKSSDEGLDQDFNSLHAQREACEAYVLSQIGEGWRALPAAYDDGGFSGGSMDRPALKRLLDDTAAGKIDVVVVYKVDRLTRSLADFAKIVEIFDARGASFVSVTQAFNTTTSMGRLTLNVLLSFAQFEREVTGERIRDKIAASKAKGMWMGGVPPLGYDLPTDPHSRALVVNAAEARVVRHIFERYLEVGSARDLGLELKAAGQRSKTWTSRGGKSMGGATLSRGALFHILTSRIYLGEIVHKGQSFPGLHQAIVSAEVFEAVAAKLADKSARRRERPTRAATGALTGLLFDANGQPLSPSFAYGRGGRLYRYYIAMALQVGRPENPTGDVIRRVSAPAVENFLVEELRRLSGGQDIEIEHLRAWLRRVELRVADTHLVVDHARLLRGEHPELALAALRRQLNEGEQAVIEPDSPPAIRIVLAQRLQLRGGRTWIRGSTGEPRRKVNPSLVTALRRAHADLLALKASPLSDPTNHVEATAPATQHERQISRMAFLAPELQRQILSGDQPAGLKLRVMLKTEMPLAWADQHEWIRTIGGR